MICPGQIVPLGRGGETQSIWRNAIVAFTFHRAVGDGGVCGLEAGGA